MSGKLTIQEFRSAVLEVLDKHEGKYNYSLEDYLLSFWAVIEKYKSHPPSYSLFVTLMDEAFFMQPQPFDRQWLAYESDLSWDYQNDEYVIQQYRNGQWIVTARNVNDFEILKHTILFQIADLHRLPAEKLSDPQRYFGIQSPTGNT